MHTVIKAAVVSIVIHAIVFLGEFAHDKYTDFVNEREIHQALLQELERTQEEGSIITWTIPDEETNFPYYFITIPVVFWGYFMVKRFSR